MRSPSVVHPIFHERSKHTTPCPHAPPSSFVAFFNDVSERILYRCSRSMRMRVLGNTPFIVRWALQLIHSGPHTVIKTDKDGGFALLPRAEYSQALIANMDPACYS